MRTRIYQINPDLDRHGVRFLSYKDLESMKDIVQIDPSLYEKVLDADLEEEDLENVYFRFNTCNHPLYYGHSMAVSDVVVTDDGAFFCDRFGYKEIEFNEDLVHKVDSMKVVYVEPHKKAYAAEIRKGLEYSQKAVDGLIECVSSDVEGVTYVCNEEAKLLGMPGNRHVDAYGSIIAGPFIVVGDDGDDFKSLTEEQIEIFETKFKYPENITMEEVMLDTGIYIY